MEAWAIPIVFRASHLLVVAVPVVGTKVWSISATNREKVGQLTP